MEKIVIVGAKRTAIGRFRGQFKEVSALNLAEAAVTGALAHAQIDPTTVQALILGEVITAGQGQNPARQVALKSGMSPSSIAMTLNMVCGSGMNAIQLARQNLMLGEQEVVVAAGVEAMSRAPWLTSQRPEKKATQLPDYDTLMRDGLKDPFTDQMMGDDTENLVQKLGLTRKEQDDWALTSQLRAAQAQASGWWSNEITPVTVDNQLLQQDECMRPTTSAEALAQLKPVFGGTLTAGNSSPLSDGAAAVVLTTERYAQRHQLAILATLEDVVAVGVEPVDFGLGPVRAVETLCTRQQLTPTDFAAVELNEAFAAQVLADAAALKMDLNLVNPHGGSLALGHPLGASGVRIVVTLLHELKTHERGLAAICVGGGMGLALSLVREK